LAIFFLLSGILDALGCTNVLFGHVPGKNDNCPLFLGFVAAAKYKPSRGYQLLNPLDEVRPVFFFFAAHRTFAGPSAAIFSTGRGTRKLRNGPSPSIWGPR